MLRVVSNAGLDSANAQAVEQSIPDNEDAVLSSLAQHIRKRMMHFRNFRNAWKINEALLESLRVYKGEYSADKLAEIKKFGGSEVYARMIASKCRGATALLRDIYLGPERPWEITPTPVPTTPDDVQQAIEQLLATEVATMMGAGQQVDPQQIQDRLHQLQDAAEKAAKKKADDETAKAADEVDDLLREGGFYEALAEFMIDLPIFPFAALKGPVVRKSSVLKWVNGTPVKESVPKLFWYRVSPFDLYWSAAAHTVEEAEFVERIKLTRADLLAVRGLPGYNNDEIDAVLQEHSDSGFRDWWDTVDQQRAVLERRERFMTTTHTMIDTAEYHGSVSGQTLLDWGMTAQEVPDPVQEYKITAWLIDKHVIKAQLNPTASQRPPYYVTSYEKVPGALIGNGLPDILGDIGQVANATIRALVNNLSIASGPQVVINDEVTAQGEDDSLYPWKRWHVSYDPMVTGSQPPITFYQPNSYADVLLNVYEKFCAMADDISALPRYMMGNEKVGGAGRTASGLSMLMGNASKTIQNVAATIDREVIRNVLDQLYEFVMLTMPGKFRGDEEIVVKGVNYAAKQEQDRMRQLEFLQLTGNPIDMQIVGPIGRANILRSIANQLGLDHEDIVPDDEVLKEQQKAAQQIQAGMVAGQLAGQAAGLPGAAAGGPDGAQGSGASPAAPPSGTPQQLPAANQIERPEQKRALPEQVRRPVEGQFTNQATGRPGMRAGG